MINRVHQALLKTKNEEELKKKLKIVIGFIYSQLEP